MMEILLPPSSAFVHIPATTASLQKFEEPKFLIIFLKLLLKIGYHDPSIYQLILCYLTSAAQSNNRFKSSSGIPIPLLHLFKQWGLYS